MKKIIAMVIALAVMLSIAVPAAVSAASRIVVKQTEDSINSVSVSWDGILGAKRYKVEISESRDSGYITDSEYVSDLKRTIYSLNTGKAYFVKVTAYINDAWDASTTSEPVQVITAPEAAENFRQTNATTSSITFKWSASPSATAYKIYERVNNQEYLLGTTAKTTYTVKKLSNKKVSDKDYLLRPVTTVGSYTAGLGVAYYSTPQLSHYDLNLIPKKAPKPAITDNFSNIGVLYFTTPRLPYQKGYTTAIYKANSTKAVLSAQDSRFSGLQENQFYKVRTRAYTTIGSQKTNKYGAWSDYLYFATGFKNINVKAHKNSLSVSWSKMKGGKVTYDISVSKSLNTSLRKFKKNVKSTSIKVTKYGKKALKRKTTYYVYITPKIKVGKKTYTSPISGYVTTATL